MMQYCVLEVRKFYHLVIQGKKIRAIALNSDFFSTLFWWYTVCLHFRNGSLEDSNLTRVFNFPSSDMLCPRYCHSADARIRTQNVLLFYLAKFIVSYIIILI